MWSYSRLTDSMNLEVQKKYKSKVQFFSKYPSSSSRSSRSDQGHPAGAFLCDQTQARSLSTNNTLQCQKLLKPE